MRDHSIKEQREAEAEAIKRKIAEFKAANPERSVEGLIVHHKGESRQQRRNRERLERKYLKQEKREYERQMEIKARFAFQDAKKQDGEELK